MTKTTLERVRVATPCHVSWDQMQGDGAVRFCGQCQLNVYNLSEMTRAEAESFVEKREGRVCIRFYRRRDGKVITRDCPVGRNAFHRQLATLAIAIVGVFVVMTSGILAAAGFNASRNSAGTSAAGNHIGGFIRDWFSPPPDAAMGDMCIPEPPTP